MLDYPTDQTSRSPHQSDVDAVESAVALATNEIAGTEKGIIDSEITLRVVGPGLPDLTLIDLPGFTRNPIAGQPEDIEEQACFL